MWNESLIRWPACNAASPLSPLILFACRLPAADVNIPYEKFTLSNGLTVLVHEDHKAPIVAVNTWYHVGSKNEKPGKTGFAHLFEHLMFGGSDNFKGRYIDAMEKVGATDLNGTTNEDRTNYFENVPVSALDYTLFLESDRMGHFYNSINKEVLDLQRGVVQNEKRQGENQPYAVAEELIVKNTAPAGHPYSWTVIGAMEDLDAAALADVQKWFQTYYGPSNAVLVLAGDIDLKTAKEKVTKYYGDIPPGPPIARPTAWIAKMTGEHRGWVQDRVPQALLTMTWNTPQWSTRDSVLLELVGQVLSDGKTSRFYKRLVYDDRIATQVQAGQNAREINGQFQIYAFAQPGAGLEKVEAAVREELARFLKDGPNDSELERVKVQYEAGLVRGTERIGGFGGKSDRLAQGVRVRRQPRTVQTGPELGAAGDQGRSAAGGARMAVGWRVHPRSPPLPGTQACHFVGGSHQASGHGQSGRCQAAQVPARHAVERIEGDSGGAPRHAAGQSLDASQGRILRRRACQTRRHHADERGAARRHQIPRFASD